MTAMHGFDISFTNRVNLSLIKFENNVNGSRAIAYRCVILLLFFLLVLHCSVDLQDLLRFRYVQLYSLSMIDLLDSFLSFVEDIYWLSSN